VDRICPHFKERESFIVPPGKATTQGALVSMYDAIRSNTSTPVPVHCTGLYSLFAAGFGAS